MKQGASIKYAPGVFLSSVMILIHYRRTNMILFYLLLFVSSASVYSVGRPVSEGDTRLSREILQILHRQAQQQRDWIRQLMKFRDELKYSDNVHEMVPVRSDFSLAKDPVYRGSYQELTTFAPHFSQKNHSLLLNNTEGDDPSDRQHQTESNKSLIPGSRPSRKDSNKEDAGHPNDEKYVNHETERNGLLTIKVGSYKINLRPNHYEAQSFKVPNIGQGNVVPFREKVTQERESYFVATPPIVDHGDFYPAAAARPVVDHGELYPDSAPSGIDHGELDPFAAPSLVDHGENFPTAAPPVDHGELDTFAAPSLVDHGDSYPTTAPPPVVEHGDSYPTADPPVVDHGDSYPTTIPPAIDQGVYPTGPPVVGHGESSFQHSVIIEQVNYVPLLHQGSRGDFEATTNGNPVSELGNSADRTPLGSSLQTRGDGRHTKFDLLNSFKAREAERDVIINGYPVQKFKDRADVSTSEELLPISLTASPGNLVSNQNSESKIEARDEYPPLLIEEVNFSDYVEPSGCSNSHNVSGELLLPKKPETEIIGRKFTAQPMQVLHATDSETIPTTETVLQIRNIPEGSGDAQPNDHQHDVEASDFLNIDANDELIVGRRGSSASDQAPFLSEEGSGEDSVEERIGGSSIRKVLPRIVDFFASRNDTSSPCTTPKGEPGYCRAIRHCILPELLNNFNLYLEYVCLIRRRFVGFCCPENPVISQIQEPDDNTTAEDSVDFSQPDKGCGVATKTRIVGGSVSNPHEWTWMVALLKKNRFFCGGVLVNNWYVLTAAHCTLGTKTRDLKIRLGEYNFLESREHQEDIGVQEIKRHAQFITLTFQHDIALLKLKRPVEFSRFVSSICLPQADKVYRDVNATAVGWGAVSFGGAASPVLRQVSLPVWNNEDCDRRYLLEDINDSFLCAGSPEPDQDACQGDSGGPLMTLNDDGRWEAIGIVSWGRRCGDPNYPGVYTRVTTYLDWIEKNMT